MNHKGSSRHMRAFFPVPVWQIWSYKIKITFFIIRHMIAYKSFSFSFNDECEFILLMIMPGRFKIRSDKFISNKR